jgi:hypothetical protein
MAALRGMIAQLHRHYTPPWVYDKLQLRSDLLAVLLVLTLDLSVVALAFIVWLCPPAVYRTCHSTLLVDCLL